jgi:23S rRNA (adenine(2503)-C(2))-methyltransferase
MNTAAVEAYLKRLELPSYRMNQLIAAIQKGAIQWAEVVGWPENLQQAFAKEVPFVTFNHASVFVSKDGTKKALLTLHDGLQIETVVMEPKPNHVSVCVSCEVGCPMNCAFCATGKMGYKRSLTAEEITDQILFWKNYLNKQQATNKESQAITSIVFMGMGEPFHNQKAVFDAINTLSTCYKFGHRHITVSTCGITQGILDFANQFPQANLAISLHAPTDELRQTIMPIARNVSLRELFNTLKQYARITKRQITFEYLLINSVNDQIEHLKQLAQLVSCLPKQLVHINLIRYNQTYGKFSPTTPTKVKHIQQWLVTHGISASIRKNLGEDINGACGQLATTNQ